MAIQPHDLFHPLNYNDENGEALLKEICITVSESALLGFTTKETLAAVRLREAKFYWALFIDTPTSLEGAIKKDFMFFDKGTKIGEICSFFEECYDIDVGRDLYEPEVLVQDVGA